MSLNEPGGWIALSKLHKHKALIKISGPGLWVPCVDFDEAVCELDKNI